MPVIYIDVLFLINFIMDSILLTVTSRISGKSPTPARIVLGGLLGGIYGASVFFAPLSFLSAGTVKLVFSAVLIFVVFGKSSAKEFVRILVSFYLSAFLLGGALASVFYFSGRPGIMSNGIYYFPLSFSRLVLVALPLGITLAFYYNKIRGRLTGHGKYCTVTLHMGNNKLTAEGIIDTGCSLVDPYCRRPAVIIDPVMAEKLLCGLSPPLRLIPFSTIDSNGFMKAFTPDRCAVTTRETTFFCNCSVAVSPAYSGGKIIVNPEILNDSGGYENDLQGPD